MRELEGEQAGRNKPGQWRSSGAGRNFSKVSRNQPGDRRIPQVFSPATARIDPTCIPFTVNGTADTQLDGLASDVASGIITFGFEFHGRFRMDVNRDCVTWIALEFLERLLARVSVSY